MAANAFEELKWRGMIYTAIDGVEELLIKEKVTVYNGFDMTADSLHIGHMVPLLALARLQRFGHTPIALAGGGTSMIGDPSFKSQERVLLSLEEVEKNLAGIKPQLEHFLDFKVKSNPARLVNNADWLMKLPLIDFMRDIGKHFSVNEMLTKDSVKHRMDRENGMSFTEFTYSLLQSYDFLYLYDTVGCKLQTGGSDQWGNITAGVELIRRKLGKSAYAMAYPLIKKADGTKFGKTESGSVWLDAKRTSPYHFFQFWLNTDDRDVINYLKYFTFLEKERIEELELITNDHPEQREAQRVLAREVTRMMHDETGLAKAVQASAVLFGGEISGLSAGEIEDIFSDVPSSVLAKDSLSGAGINVVDLVAGSSLAKSKGEARRSIQEGGISVNNHKVNDEKQMITLNDVIEGSFLVLRKGKKNYHLVKVQ